MTDPRNGASSRRSFVRGSAAAVAIGSAFSRNPAARAQDVAPSPTSTDDTHYWTNVRNFGAKGDGKTDDSGAIQLAIDNLGENGGTVYFPAGDYAISTALTIRSNIELLGESRAARILAATEDAAIKVADTQIYNSDIIIRRLEIRNSAETPIGVDARYMIGCLIDNCEVTQFSTYGIYYGGNTDENNAAWSNTLIDSLIRNSPTCIYLYGIHSTGGSPANWITIERCQISPDDTIDGIGIDLQNGGQVRILNNDISYASNATAVVIRAHRLAEFQYNRFEDIGDVAPSHQIEKEFGLSTFQIIGAMAEIHYQTAEYLEFTGQVDGGSFTLTRGDETTGSIDYSTDTGFLAESIQAELENLAAVGAGNVVVTDESETRLRIAWLNGRGRSDRPNLTADASELSGDGTPELNVVQGTIADAIAYSRDMALAGVVNDTESPHLDDLGEHLDIGIPVVTRQPMVSVRAPRSAGLQLQQDTESYPRMELSVDGRIGWIDHETGKSIGGLKLLSSNLENPKVGWDDNLNVALPRRTTDEGDEAVGEVHRGALHRYEGEPGERDRLRIGVRDKDDSTYLRHLYAGFPATQDLEIPSIPTGSVAGVTMMANGARVGDAVMVIPPSNLPVGFTAFGFVSDENTVTIRVLNGSGEEQQPDVATWSVLVLQP